MSVRGQMSVNRSGSEKIGRNQATGSQDQNKPKQKSDPKKPVGKKY